MSIQAGAEKRRGKRVIGERRTRSESQTSTVIVEGYTIEEAFELFLRVKEAENVKPRTRKEYDVQYRYFTEWLEGYAPDVKYIGDITTSMIRDYIHYLAHDKTKYEGNPYKKDEYKQEKGLSPYTINIRIRFLKSWFNVLVKERILPHSPMQTIKLMKVDEDTKEPLIEDEVRLLLQQPNQRLYAQYRDYVMMTLFIDSGMRVNEVCSLDIEDIDFKSRYIHLPASKNKNRKTRIIPLSSETIRLLLDLINETKQYFDFKLAYNQINSWKEGNPVIDGEGISGTFFGIPLNLNYDEGIHYSDVLGYANSLLILGVLLLVGSIVLLFKVYKVKN
ncbi:tyrosine-type recombinase/integrase [Ammoniphilus sp. 3BR4]|uniref:tyrosine-type recombinase/integrase n=1 Tax=Ammoniphilus sp. 3BR4 TaxID=3158265 RepID=UPI0034675FE9